ncbi:MAG TPA: squalene/phytoene synthase family protein [Candidatus Cybelea sp.]|nr:squalene/phytoene synthase family protein [Candidatus Cybelea sp.]
MASTSIAASDADYCAALVRRFDADRWLALLFAPAESRPALHVLHAFNVEVARTREQVSQAMLGEIRLQWWRETLDGVFAGTPRPQPIATALAAVVSRFGLPRLPFDRLIDAHGHDLYETPPADFPAMETYGADTSGALAELSLAVLGALDHDSMQAARRVAVAWTMLGLARAVPSHAKQRRIHIPADLLAREKIDAEAIFAGGDRSALVRIVASISERANQLLSEARTFRADRAALPLLLPAAIGDLYVRRLARAGFDPYAAALDVAGPRKQMRLFGKALLGRF